MFKQNFEKINYPEIEERILKFWQDHKVFEKSVDKRDKAKSFTFYEGPPTANGKPGIHHVMARTLKILSAGIKHCRVIELKEKPDGILTVFLLKLK
jgi:isoleucyl-tRNA synthetase